MRTTPATAGCLHSVQGRLLALLCVGGALAPLPALADTPVSLTAGHDYALAASANAADGTAELVAPGGAVVARVFATVDAQSGAEVRARFTATYRIRANPGVVAGVDVDCRADRRTLCTLPVGRSFPARGFNFGGDTDWFSTALRRGQRYQARLTNDAYFCGALSLRDARGRRLPTTTDIVGDVDVESFTAPYTGAYYLVAESACDAGRAYGVALQLQR